MISLGTPGPGAVTPQDPVPAIDERRPDDLAAKLIRKTVDETTADDPMKQMLQDMTDIARKLQVDFDPGEQTQAQQRQVSASLDKAIKEAAARRRAQSKPDPKQQSDKRTMPSPKKTAPQAAAKKQPGDAQAKPTSESAASGSAESKESQKSDVPTVRRGWGNLPQRDREEVIQGAEEESLERFRLWIDQYFRALQESNR